MPMRIEITQQGVGDTSQAFCPGFQARLAVNADTQDLGIDPIEPVQTGLVGWDLARSYGGPGQREKGQYHIFLAKIIA